MNIVAGQYVAGSGGSADSGAMTIAADGRPVIAATVGEGDVGNLKVGDPVDLLFDAYPGVSFSGKVDEPAAPLHEQHEWHLFRADRRQRP